MWLHVHKKSPALPVLPTFNRPQEEAKTVANSTAVDSESSDKADNVNVSDKVIDDLLEQQAQNAESVCIKCYAEHCPEGSMDFTNLGELIAAGPTGGVD